MIVIHEPADSAAADGDERSRSGGGAGAQEAEDARSIATAADGTDATTNKVAAAASVAGAGAALSLSRDDINFGITELEARERAGMTDAQIRARDKEKRFQEALAKHKVQWLHSRLFFS